MQPGRRLHFLDASVKFVGETEVVTDDEDVETCYTGLKYKLFPDVSDEVWEERKKKVKKFLDTVFYNNEGAQALWLASERLALEGYVSKRMLMIIGKGGCGKSELPRLAKLVYGAQYRGVGPNNLRAWAVSRDTPRVFG